MPSTGALNMMVLRSRTVRVELDLATVSLLPWLTAASMVAETSEPGPDSLEVAADGVALAKLYMRGEAPRALTRVPALFKRALDIRQSHLGESSPDLAEVWHLYAEAITASFTEAAEGEDVAPEQALKAGETALAAAEGVLDGA